MEVGWQRRLYGRDELPPSLKLWRTGRLVLASQVSQRLAQGVARASRPFFPVPLSTGGVSALVLRKLSGKPRRKEIPGTPKRKEI
jgi:hypothetical protein